MTKEIEKKFQEALSLHRAGRLREADVIYGSILEAVPDHFDCLHLKGVLAVQSGKHEMGEVLIRRALAVNSGEAPAYNNLGNALRGLKRHDEARDCYEKAIAIRPDYAEAHNNRGVVLIDLGRPDEALICFLRALDINQKYPEAYYNRGNALKSLGRREEALACFEKAILLRSNYPAAHYNCGVVLQDLGNFAGAIGSYEKAIEINPRYAEACNNCGFCLQKIGRLEEAIIYYQKALSINSAYIEACNNLGNALKDSGRLGDSLQYYDRALSINPDYAVAHCNRAAVLKLLRRPDEALAACDKALTLKPDFPQALNVRAGLLIDQERFEEALVCCDKAIALDRESSEVFYTRGLALRELRRFEEALASYEKLISIDPESDYFLGSYLLFAQGVCDWRVAARHLEQCVAGVNAGKKTSLPFPLLALVDSPTLQKKCAGIFGNAKFPGGDFVFPATARSSGKIRIGYFSADFHGHATSHLMVELLERHDRDRFDVIGFSFGPEKNDSMRRRVRAAFDQFIDVRNMADAEIVQLARNMGIDIAVDLKGYTKDSRTAIFSARCAPIQVNYLGYPGTMGVDFMDYIVADHIVAPAESSGDFSEQIVHMPNCYQVNDSTREISERNFLREECGLPAEGFIFCCFNNNYKIIPAVFDSWMRMLLAVEGSVLWLLEDNPLAAKNLVREAVSRGVEGDRLVFAKRMPLAEHLARHRLADLFVDTLPCNAHTTASDALWAGLPVLTCLGNSFAGRVAASLLNAMQLPELVTNSLDAYEAKAIELARDPAALLALRQRIELQRKLSPLFDGQLFARHLEAAYEAMVARHRAGLAPAPIEVLP